MRKDFRPELEVRGRLEDCIAWRVDENGIAGVHERRGWWRLRAPHDKLSDREDKSKWRWR